MFRPQIFRRALATASDLARPYNINVGRVQASVNGFVGGEISYTVVANSLYRALTNAIIP